MDSKINSNADRNKTGDEGFTLIELVLYIAIVAVIVGFAGLNLVRYIETARKSKILNAARDLYNECELSVAQFEEYDFFGRTLILEDGMNKWDPVYGWCGRISNLSLRNRNKAVTTKSKKNAAIDQTIAKDIAAAFPTYTEGNRYANASPNNRYCKDLDPRNLNFMCIYNTEGCLYVEFYYKNFFVHYDRETTVDDVINVKKYPQTKFTNVTEP